MYFASKGWALGRVSPVPSFMSTNSPPTTSQSKHWSNDLTLIQASRSQSLPGTAHPASSERPQPQPPFLPLQPFKPLWLKFSRILPDPRVILHRPYVHMQHIDLGYPETAHDAVGWRFVAGLLWGLLGTGVRFLLWWTGGMEAGGDLILQWGGCGLDNRPSSFVLS